MCLCVFLQGSNSCFGMTLNVPLNPSRNSSLWLSPGLGRFLGPVWAAHLSGEALPSGFCPGQGWVQLTSGPSSALWQRCLQPPGALHPECEEWLGCCLGLCLASAKVKLSGRMKGEGALAWEDGGGGGEPRLQPGSPFMCKPGCQPCAWNTPMPSSPC